MTVDVKHLINPYLTNGFSHHYHLGESASVFRDIRCDFLSHLLIAGCDIGVQISVRPFVRSFVRSSVNIYVEVWFSRHQR